MQKGENRLMSSMSQEFLSQVFPYSCLLFFSRFANRERFNVCKVIKLLIAAHWKMST